MPPSNIQLWRGTIYANSSGVSDDPLKAKHLGNALQQLAEEGVARVFKTLLDNAWIVGVVGMLQFDVLIE